jgi:hypothetical protein
MSNRYNRSGNSNDNRRNDAMKEELNKAIDMIDDGFLSMGIEHEFETLERMAYELLHFEFNKEEECCE